MKIEIIVKPNFIYPEITPQHFKFGARKEIGAILQTDGDWRKFLPLEEDQFLNSIDSSACYIYAQQSAIATILEQQYKIYDQNFSARFNALLSEGTPDGGDPLAGGDSMRKDGLINEILLPFTERIRTWEEYHSFKYGSEILCRRTGREFLRNWQLNYDIVFEMHENPQIKYKKLREALKKSPVPMSVYGWVENGDVMIKPEGIYDQHLALCVYLDDENRPYFWDTYSPYLKIGEPFYNSDFAMRWTVTKLDSKKKVWRIINWIKLCLQRI